MAGIEAGIGIVEPMAERVRARRLLGSSASAPMQSQRWRWPQLCPASWRDRRANALARLLDHLVRVGDARLCVMLGAGDGVAAVSLAAALREGSARGEDRALIVCEPRIDAARRLRDVLRRVELSRLADVRLLGPEQGLAALDQPIDLVFVEDADAAMVDRLPLAGARLRVGASMIVAGRCAPDRLRATLAASDLRFEHLALPLAGGVHWLVKR